MLSLRSVVLCSIAAACLFSSQVWADPSAEQAPSDLASLFTSGRYPDALSTLLANPRPDNAAYEYNLGTVHLKLGSAGPALAHLEKANRLKHHDPDIQSNLQIARNEVSKVIGAERLDPASTAVERLADRIAIEEVRGTIGLLAFLLSGLWLRSYLKLRSVRRMILNPASVVLLLASAITGALYAAQRYTELHPPAILLEGQAVRSGPGNGYIELARLEAGTKLRIADTTGAPEEGAPAPSPATTSGASANVAAQPAIWLQVRFSPQEIGWVRASSMLLL